MNSPVRQPSAVRYAYFAWFIAIGAGIFETALVVYAATVGINPQDGLVPGVAVRVLLFVLMSWVVTRMGQGKNWARLVLTVMLGVLGSLSLLVGPVEWLSSGQHWEDSLQGVTATEYLFFASRLLHILAVWSGVLFMYVPSSRKYFK